jgi:4-hydroxy-2-oxoheptanedioate aldolase
MKKPSLRDAIRSGRTTIGTLLVSPSPCWPDALEGLPLDFVFIDTEHIPLDDTQVAWMCQTYRRMDFPPIVRIPSPDPNRAAKVLDAGAGGVVAPYVETREQVRALRGAVRYRPLKGARLEAALNGEPLEPELAAFLERRNASSVLMLNIESVPAMERMDDLLSEPGIDGVIIGPHDLSVSLGIAEQWDHPRLGEAFRTIFRKARERGVGAGIHGCYADDVQLAHRWLQEGATLLIHSADLLLFRSKLAADLATFREVRDRPVVPI